MCWYMWNRLIDGVFIMPPLRGWLPRTSLVYNNVTLYNNVTPSGFPNFENHYSLIDCSEFYNYLRL